MSFLFKNLFKGNEDENTVKSVLKGSLDAESLATDNIIKESSIHESKLAQEGKFDGQQYLDSENEKKVFFPNKKSNQKSMGGFFKPIENKEKKAENNIRDLDKNKTIEHEEKKDSKKGFLPKEPNRKMDSYDDISFTIGDIALLFPPNLLDQGDLPDDHKLPLDIQTIINNVKTGNPTISAYDIYKACPEIFKYKLDSSDPMKIPISARKLSNILEIIKNKTLNNMLEMSTSSSRKEKKTFQKSLKTSEDDNISSKSEENLFEKSMDMDDVEESLKSKKLSKIKQKFLKTKNSIDFEADKKDEKIENFLHGFDDSSEGSKEDKNVKAVNIKDMYAKLNTKEMDSLLYPNESVDSSREKTGFENLHSKGEKFIHENFTENKLDKTSTVLPENKPISLSKLTKKSNISDSNSIDYTKKHVQTLNKKVDVSNSKNNSNQLHSFKLGKILRKVDAEVLGFQPKHIPDDLQSFIPIPILQAHFRDNRLTLSLGDIINGCQQKYFKAFKNTKRDELITIADKYLPLELSSKTIPKEVQVEAETTKREKIDSSNETSFNSDKNVKTSVFANTPKAVKSHFVEGHEDNFSDSNTPSFQVNNDIGKKINPNQLVLRAIYGTSEDLEPENILVLIAKLPRVEAVSLFSKTGELYGCNWSGGKENEDYAKRKAPKIFRNIIDMNRTLEVSQPKNFSFVTNNGMMTFFMGQDLSISILQKSSIFAPGVMEKIIVSLNELEVIMNG